MGHVVRVGTDERARRQDLAPELRDESRCSLRNEVRGGIVVSGHSGDSDRDSGERLPEQRTTEQTKNGEGERALRASNRAKQSCSG